MTRLVKNVCPRAQTLFLRNPRNQKKAQRVFRKVYHDPIHHGFKAVSQRAPTFRSWGALSVRCFRNRLIRSIIDWYLKGIAWKTFKYLEQLRGYELSPELMNSGCPDPQQQETVTGEYKTPELISKQSVKMPTKKCQCHHQKEQAGTHQQKKSPVNRAARDSTAWHKQEGRS